MTTVVRRPGLERLSIDRQLLAERLAERLEGAPSEPGEQRIDVVLAIIVQLDKRIAEIAHAAGAPSGDDRSTLRALVVALATLPPGSHAAASILAKAIVDQLTRGARARRELRREQPSCD